MDSFFNIPLLSYKGKFVKRIYHVAHYKLVNPFYDSRLYTVNWIQVFLVKIFR